MTLPRDLPPSWRDHLDRPTDTPPMRSWEPGVGGVDSHYEAIGDFQGGDYRRNAFALHTDHEVDALERMLGLRPGSGILDIGCGNGRHLNELARRGHSGLGIDLSPSLVDVARRSAAEDELSTSFLAIDARDFLDGDPPLDVRGVPQPAFDAAISLHHGAFGTNPVTDGAVLAGMARHVKPGGRIVLTAFHALCAVRNLVEGDSYDALHGVHHHLGDVRGPDGAHQGFDLWTSAYTARELALLAHTSGLHVEWIQGAEPGRYDGPLAVALDDSELLLVATVR